MRIELDSRDSRILKGLAIAAIVFHNFFHLVNPAREDEFSFDPARFQLFLHEVGHPTLTIQTMFSFWGHYGVQIFVFLSAYGLAKSHWHDAEPWEHFLMGRIKKLYPVFGLVIVPWMITQCILVGRLRFTTHIAPELALMGLGASTLFGVAVPIGPWWFIPFYLSVPTRSSHCCGVSLIRFGPRSLVILIDCLFRVHLRRRSTACPILV